MPPPFPPTRLAAIHRVPLVANPTQPLPDYTTARLPPSLHGEIERLLRLGVDAVVVLLVVPVRARLHVQPPPGLTEAAEPLELALRAAAVFRRVGVVGRDVVFFRARMGGWGGGW